ncbi:root phototropism protein 3 [Physcomitrium patens]|uniref:NPH3 domain-containing protein n=1 Tax=Physcomitrium patens TaxID=3218 RepID=A0A2K1KMU9_PHYPA|nr:uncharacterized protein LOC112281921 [Physcomitrium patens]PNR55102.1 hypothetical protein PHYPA_005995 [Physcomitrium patens]|eukprot:XP_024374724.1 uncharacterized protein LOC112281921 [Physcomitrella patens]
MIRESRELAMPPSQSRSSKSAEDSNSGGRASSASAKYIDIDIDNDMVVKALIEKRSSHSRNGRQAPPVGVVHTWGGATDLHINLQIEVGDRNFLLHKFPLLSRSGKLNRLVFESRDTEKDRIALSDIPGGAEAFELIASFLYGGRLELNPSNVATVRCAAEYLEMLDNVGDGNLVTKTENYMNYVVMGSWRDSIAVLKTCSSLKPWADDLEIVRRCSESIAWKCSTDPQGTRWSFNTKAGAREAPRDWWFDDVCSLDIDTFSKVIHGVILKGMNQALVGAAIEYYAEKWLQLTKGSDMSTTLKRKEELQASFMAFTGFNQDIIAKDAKQAQTKNRAIVQGIVNLIPSQPDSTSVKFLLKLLRVACLVNAGSFCRTDLAKRIGSQLEKVSLDDLLIPACGESTYDVDIVQQIVEFYLQDQSYGNSPPFSPRSVFGTTSTTSLSSSLRSLSSVSTSDSSGSSVTTEISTSSRSISGSSASDSSSVRTSDTGSSTNGTSSSLSSRRSSLSFVSSSSETSSTSTRSDHSRTSSIASSETSSSALSSDESVKLEKKFYVTEGPTGRRFQLPLTTMNFKVAQLLETYLEEVAKDSSIPLGRFISLADLVAEFPRDSDDALYKAIDTFLRSHPTLTELERKKLCRVIDTGNLSLAASVHAASNERLPLRVIVQVLFSEQIKLRNAMTGNDVVNDKELDNGLSSFSSTTSRTESSIDPTSSTNSSSSVPTKSRCNSISSASGLNLGIASPSVASTVSSQLLGGLSIKETLRFVLAEVESLRKSILDIETVKSRLNVIDALRMDMENLSLRFHEMSHDYTGMTQQVEELTRGSKSKSGWSSGWKKVTKSFQSKDHHDNTVKAVAEQHKIEPPLLPRIKVSEPTDGSGLPALKTSKSDALLSKTPRADTTLLSKTSGADPLSAPKTPKAADLKLQLPKTPISDSKPTTGVVTPSVPVKIEVIETLPQKHLSKVAPETLKEEAPLVPTTRPEKDVAPETNCTRDGSYEDRRKEECAITIHRRRMSRSLSLDHVHPRRRNKELDSVSVTSTSSHTTTSTTISSHSDYRHRQYRDYSEDRHDKIAGHRDSSLNRHRSRHHKSSVHRSEQSSGHGRHGRRDGSEEHSRRNNHHSPEHSHRKHRQKEGPGHYYVGQNGHNHKDQHSVDSHPRQSSKDAPSPSPVHHSSHPRYKETPDNRSSHRRSHRKESSKHSSQHHRHRRHRPKEVFTDSDSSTDSGTRRRHR